MARGLAAIRRKNSNQDLSNEKKDNPEMNKPATYFFSTNSSEVCSNRKTRLNNLAAQINGWEDNLSSKPIISKANIVNERKNVNKPMGKEDTKKLPPREIFSRSISKDVKETLNSSFEPSNLPLSARKALFEQGTVSTQLQKQSIEPQLSVAQRAAMFENASKKQFTPSSPVKPPAKSACDNVVKSSSGLSCKSPVKLTGGSTCESPVKSAVRLNTASPIKLTTGSPNKPLASLICASPVKSVASVICASPVKASAESTCGSPLKSSARMNEETPSKSFVPKPPVEPSFSPSQRQWVETVSKDTGKKQEISSLVSHWEKLSSSSVPTSQSEEEYTAPVEKVPFTSNEENELNKSESVSDGQNESGSCDEQESILEESDEEDDTFMESATFNPKEFSTAAGLDTETDSMAQTDDDARSSVTDQYSAKSSISEGSSHFSHSLSSSSCGTEDGEEHPLQYTVSFYRKQKQETRNSPVRTIVRREPSHKTEPTQACNTQDIQERIQRLQEEVMRHQTVISQTSQALTLCLSTAEFSGSAEQVEGERLLLIAIQLKSLSGSTLLNIRLSYVEVRVAKECAAPETVAHDMEEMRSP
ncbi:anillin [Caerostris extrusa]|uniref:Anillin n=1 Tax=Caerostris extrusa TaxID=172846 RepID=A0AAV4UYY9_CAEEX|nr:anillin [Caerostris extrusa]